MPWNIATITTIGYLCPYNHEDMRICHRRKDGDMRMGGRDAGVSDVVATYGICLWNAGRRPRLSILRLVIS